LNSSLNDSLTTVAILKSDLQSFKSQLSERQTMLLQYEKYHEDLKEVLFLLSIFREKQLSSNNYREKELLQSNIRQLVYGEFIEKFYCLL
jgi:hypothetical protein